jgi:K+-sensing histidine kinase KdpD
MPRAGSARAMYKSIMGVSLTRLVECGRIELGMREVELGDLVLDAVDLVLPLVIMRRQLLVTDITEEGLLVNVDARMMTQALERLLTNVAKLAAREGTITITTRRHASRAMVTVTSSTLPNATIEDLGLSYVAQLCELHEGALLTAPGHLRIMLPHRE